MTKAAEVKDVAGPDTNLTYPYENAIVVENVLVDRDNAFIGIKGYNFDNGSTPVVTLSGVGTLKLVGSPTADMIGIALPEVIDSGDYLMTISTGDERGQTGTYDLTLGVVGNGFR